MAEIRHAERSPLFTEDLMAKVATLFCGVALAIVSSAATPNRLQGQTVGLTVCYQCNPNFPVGSQCRVVNRGYGICWEDAQGCHASIDCTNPDNPPVGDTANSNLVTRYSSAHLELRRAGTGFLFVRYDAGKVSMPIAGLNGGLVVRLCSGKEEALATWLDEVKHFENLMSRKTTALDADASGGMQ
jgi:hypothetical protein